MFKSKLRPIVIPQTEHGKLAGALAFLWGNAQFDQPTIDFSSFVTGVELHDRGYGFMDTAPLLETSEETWLQLTRHGFYLPMADPSADLIVKLHLKRLTSYDKTAPRQTFLAEMTHVIENQIAQHHLDREEFQRIDRITNFCDSLSFNFCFEQPAQGTVNVFPKNDSATPIPLNYAINAGEIIIDPWPLAVESYTGYLVGYQSQGYPTMPAPVMVPYRITKQQA